MGMSQGSDVGDKSASDTKRELTDIKYTSASRHTQRERMSENL